MRQKLQPQVRQNGIVNSAERESVLWQFFLQKHRLLSLLPPHSSQKLTEYPRNLYLAFSYRTYLHNVAIDTASYTKRRVNYR